MRLNDRKKRGDLRIGKNGARRMESRRGVSKFNGEGERKLNLGKGVLGVCWMNEEEGWLDSSGQKNGQEDHKDRFPVRWIATEFYAV